MTFFSASSFVRRSNFVTPSKTNRCYHDCTAMLLKQGPSFSWHCRFDRALQCNICEVKYEVIPSTLLVCASLDTPTIDSDKLGENRQQFHYCCSLHFHMCFPAVWWITWVWGVLHGNHKHRGSGQIDVGWDSSLSPGWAHCRAARIVRKTERKWLIWFLSGLNRRKCDFSTWTIQVMALKPVLASDSMGTHV